MKKGLTATQLELTAIIIMICAHLGKLYLDFYWPCEQAMYILDYAGMPIFWFLGVKEYQSQTNRLKYILSLCSLWVVSMVPYHVYYSGREGIKQNLFFDLLLGLGVLYVLDLKMKNFLLKALLISIILVSSVHFSNTPLVPLGFMIGFKQYDSYESMRKYIAKMTFGLFFFMAVFKISTSGWRNVDFVKFWQNQISMLGCFLSLPIIGCYKKNSGNRQNLRYFLYILYPLHFLVIKFFAYMTPQQKYLSYIYIQILTIFLTWLLGYITLQAKISRAQISNMLIIVFCLFFMVGNYLKATSNTADAMWAASKVIYLGLAGMIIGITWFINQFCDCPLGNNVFILEAICTGMLIYSLFITDNRSLFFQSIRIKHYPYHCAALVRPGIMYYAFYMYLTVIWIVLFSICFRKMKESLGNEKKAIQMLLVSLFIPAVILVIRFCHINKEYDNVVFAIFSFISFFTIALVKNDYLSNVQTEEELDPLTGLSNRGFFIAQVQRKLSSHIKGTMLMMDMDNFKSINDNYGHGTGDKVLIALADAMKEVVSANHYIARLGGDEFCLFLCNTVNKKELEKITRNILTAFKKNVEEHKELNPTISIGLAIYNGKKNKTFEELYENADKALYVAKNSGKSQYRFYA